MIYSFLYPSRAELRVTSYGLRVCPSHYSSYKQSFPFTSFFFFPEANDQLFHDLLMCSSLFLNNGTFLLTCYLFYYVSTETVAHQNKHMDVGMNFILKLQSCYYAACNKIPTCKNETFFFFLSHSNCLAFELWDIDQPK